MAIITSLPVILQNGTTADATQVMANFNAIVNAVNTNAAHSGINSDITELTALTVALTVPQGGTGQQALTANGVLVGAGSSGISAVAPGTAGQPLVSNGPGSDPSFQTINSIPTGGMIFWPTAVVPAGFVEANGQSTASLPTLAPIYGANLPDNRGLFIRVWDNGAGVDPGRAILSTQTDAIASHSVAVAITDAGHSHTVPSNANFAGISDILASANVGGDVNDISTTVVTTGITAAGTYTGAAETRPKNIAWMSIIKT